MGIYTLICRRFKSVRGRFCRRHVRYNPKMIATFYAKMNSWRSNFLKPIFQFLPKMLRGISLFCCPCDQERGLFASNTFSIKNWYWKCAVLTLLTFLRSIHINVNIILAYLYLYISSKSDHFDNAHVTGGDKLKI